MLFRGMGRGIDSICQMINKQSKEHMQAGPQGRLPGGGRVWRTGILQKETGHPRQKGEERQRHRPKGEHGVVREWAKNQGAGARTQCELRKASSLRAPCPITSPAAFRLAGGDLHLRRISLCHKTVSSLGADTGLHCSQHPSVQHSAWHWQASVKL